MKVLKFYERLNENTPEVGDYVIVDRQKEYRGDNDIYSFTSNNIGKIFSYGDNINYPYSVEFSDIPYNIKNNFYENRRNYRDYEILYCSKDKEELYKILQAKKFNL